MAAALHPQHQQQQQQQQQEIIELISSSPSPSPSRSHCTSTVLLTSFSNRNPPDQLQQEILNTHSRRHQDGGDDEEDDDAPRAPNKPYACFGSRDLFKPLVWQATFMELAVSMVMTFTSIAAVIACLKSNFSSPRIAIAILQSLIYTASILAAAPVSGGHLNPSLSLATMLTGHFSVYKCILYIMGQSAGSALGAMIAKQIISPQLATQYFLGGCLLKQQIIDSSGGMISVGVGVGKGLVAEIMFSFFLISLAFPLILHPVIRNLLPESRRALEMIKGAILTGILLGLLIFISGELLSPGYTSAGMNPARCFGPAIVQKGYVVWHSGQWVFLIGPLIAAALYALVYRIVNIFHKHQGEELHQSHERPVDRPQFIITTPESHPALSPYPPSAAPISRRMDVFLHIKAVMQKTETPADRSNSGSLLQVHGVARDALS